MQFIDLHAQKTKIEKQLKDSVLNVIDNGQYILGPQVFDFEKKLEKYVGVRNVISCANGTDALLLPLMAYSIGANDAVFCPSFTFAATAEVIALCGAQPVFIDIEEENYNIDTNQLILAIEAIKKEGKLTPKAIIAVDLFGLPANYEALTKIAKDYNLLLIEDAAQSLGASSKGTMCGAFGHVGTTSFYPAKPLGCYGDGGAIFTNDDDLAKKLRSLAFHGKGVSQYDNLYIGLNSRLDTLQAAILIEKLAIFEDEIIKRNEIAKRYNDCLKDLKDFVKTPVFPENARSVYAQYTLSVKDRNALKLFLNERSIPTMIYYEKPLHLQTAYKDYPRAPEGLLVSEKLSNSVLSLPMHPYLSIKDQDFIVQSIFDFYKP